MNERLAFKNHVVDLCVVGGGLAGLCAAVAAARRGAKVALMQDRPVLGGNASSEIRMWVCGAHGKDTRETGILEEIALDNLHRNPHENYSIWDSILYEKARFEPNILLLLNCSCNDLEMEGQRITAVKGWQLTTETWHRVEAKLFADCSGDSILAPLSGAEFRLGREASSAFDEDIEPPVADRRTMGMSCLLQARETDRPQTFVPPHWARVFAADDDLPNRHHGLRQTNFWWIELGGEDDSIHDSESLRDELLKITFGVWDHIKNHGDHEAGNWVLDWVGFLPGKRESRRYVGDHTLTQGDVRAEGRFADLVAYGGWSMDDHHPAGFRHPGQPTLFHPAPSPFGIPYRSLYSRNIDNLFFAGRNISATHAAMSATRVMATCGTMGQAIGTAAALAVAEGCDPRGIQEHHIEELQRQLMDDDCYLPWQARPIPALSADAHLTASTGAATEALLNGIDRSLEEADNGITIPLDGWLMYEWDQAVDLGQARLTLDSNLTREPRHHQRCAYPLDAAPRCVPEILIKAFRIEARATADGAWQTVFQCPDNHQRLVQIPLAITAQAVRLVPTETWGAAEAHLFAWDLR